MLSLFRFSVRNGTGRGVVRLLGLAVLSTLLAACGGSSGDPPAANQERVAAVEDGVVRIQPLGNQMKYKQTEFTVAPGQEIRLIFENTATSPSMKHNVVVIAEPSATGDVAQKGMSMPSEEYVPPSMSDAILAYTSMSDPGETVEVTFTAPSDPGDYPYICTFPGHYPLMEGTMHVREGGS
jgi:azurin